MLSEKWMIVIKSLDFVSLDYLEYTDKVAFINSINIIWLFAQSLISGVCA